MQGLDTLRIVIGSIQASAQTIDAIAYVLSRRPPRSLEEVERALLEHLADVENALAHVRLMRHGERPPSCTCNPGYPAYVLCPTHGTPEPAHAA